MLIPNGLNDTITTEEIRVGDNDRLAAKGAQMVGADDFVILTGVDGLYDRNPDEPGAKFIAEVEDVGMYMDATKGKSTLGTGGMESKLRAAALLSGARSGGFEGSMSESQVGGVAPRPFFFV